MSNVLGIVGTCYYRGWAGLPYPKHCRKEKGNPTWEMYKQGREDRKKGLCNMPPDEIEKLRKQNDWSWLTKKIIPKSE